MSYFTTQAELDARLDRISASTELYLCSSQPTTRAEAITASLGLYTLTSGDYSAYADYTGPEGGRYTTVSAQSGNNATADGDGTHVALCDGTNLIAVIPCATLTVSSGFEFRTTAFNIIAAQPTIPG